MQCVHFFFIQNIFNFYVLLVMYPFTVYSIKVRYLVDIHNLYFSNVAYYVKKNSDKLMNNSIVSTKELHNFENLHYRSY